MMADMKVITVRLASERADELEAVAEIDGESTNEATRHAVDAYVAARKADHEFQARLTASRERNREILDRLAQA